MACYPFCKWDDLQTSPMSYNGQPPTVTCGMCGEMYSADATFIDPLTTGEHVEKLARLVFSAMQKIQDLEDRMEDHINQYVAPSPDQADLHLTQSEVSGLRDMMAVWYTLKDVEAAQKEEDEKLSQARKGKRMDQAFWTMPNPERTDGKW